MRDLADVRLLFQKDSRAPRVRNKEEEITVNAPELYRAIGTLEATVKQLVESVAALLKGQGEGNVIAAQVSQKLDSLGSDTSEAHATAKEALAHAHTAHERIDQIVWVCVGVGVVGSLLIALLTNNFEYFMNLIGRG